MKDFTFTKLPKAETVMPTEEFHKQNNIDAWSIVRANTNGYLFVTAVSSGVAENIYLSKGLCETVSIGDEPDFLLDTVIRVTANEKGQARVKICRSRGKDYSNPFSMA